MNSSESIYDESHSSKTIILWKNEEHPVSRTSNHNHTSTNAYKVSGELSENYLYLITKTADDLVNRVIKDSEWIVKNFSKK